MARITTHPLKEKSRLSAGLSCSRQLRSELAALFGILALLRILLLLAGLLPAALLLAWLLTGLLARVLILLAGIVLVVLVRHFRDLRC
jgi:hypothetical protein